MSQQPHSYGHDDDGDKNANKRDAQSRSRRPSFDRAAAQRANTRGMASAIRRHPNEALPPLTSLQGPPEHSYARTGMTRDILGSSSVQSFYDQTNPAERHFSQVGTTSQAPWGPSERQQAVLPDPTQMQGVSYQRSNWGDRPQSYVDPQSRALPHDRNPVSIPEGYAYSQSRRQYSDSRGYGSGLASQEPLSFVPSRRTSYSSQGQSRLFSPIGTQSAADTSSIPHSARTMSTGSSLASPNIMTQPTGIVGQTPVMPTASGAGTQYMTLETEQGSMSIPLDIRAASRVADEKRKRNAGASARFRARRKEKENANNHQVEGLNQQIRDLTDDAMFYQRERDILAHALYNTLDGARHFPRPASPRRIRLSRPQRSSNEGSEQTLRQILPAYEEQGNPWSDGRHTGRHHGENMPPAQSVRPSSLGTGVSRSIISYVPIPGAPSSQSELPPDYRDTRPSYQGLRNPPGSQLSFQRSH